MTDYDKMKACKPGLTVLGKLRIKDTVDPVHGRSYVYQRVKPGLGNVTCSVKKNLQLRLNPPQFDPQTPAQLTQRQKLINANSAWHLLSPGEKDLWREIGKNKHLPGYQTFISAMIR